MLRVNTLKINTNVCEGVAFAGGLVGLCCCCGVTPSVCAGQQRLFSQILCKPSWLGSNLWKCWFYTSAATSNKVLPKEAMLASREECEGLVNIAKCLALTL